MDPDTEALIRKFYGVLVAGVVVIALALSALAFNSFNKVECTSVYYVQEAFGVEGKVQHTCFDRLGNVIGVPIRDTVGDPRTPPLNDQ